MIKLQKLTQTDTAFLKAAKKIYESAFPSNERRVFKEVKNMLADKRFNFSVITFEDSVVGIITLWDFVNFVYIEHFAITEAFRNNGLGTYVMKKILQDEARQIVLEVDLPENELSLKRIQFYKRFGFEMYHETYIQPAYSKDKMAVPMLIMTTQEMDARMGQHLIKTLHQEVYGFFE
ncbi:MAG: GNAT family N-acetyltransferase [Bacteroidales bacterium]